MVFTESDCPPPPSDLTRTDWAVRPNDYASGVIFWCAYLKTEKRQIAGVGERVFTLALAELFLMRIDSEEEARELFLNIIGLEARAKLAQDGRVVDGTAERVTVKFQREKPSANNLEQWTYEVFRYTLYRNYIIYVVGHAESEAAAISYCDYLEREGRSLAESKGFSVAPVLPQAPASGTVTPTVPSTKPPAPTTSGAPQTPVEKDGKTDESSGTTDVKSKSGVIDFGGGSVPARKAAAAGAAGAAAVGLTALLLNWGTTAASSIASTSAEAAEAAERVARADLLQAVATQYQSPDVLDKTDYNLELTHDLPDRQDAPLAEEVAESKEEADVADDALY